MFNKDDIIDELCKKCFLNKEEALRIVNSLFDIIVDKLNEEQEVNIAGFGKFKIKERKEKEIYNPTVKGMVNIPNHRVIDFKEGKKVKNKLNNN